MGQTTTVGFEDKQLVAYTLAYQSKRPQVKTAPSQNGPKSKRPQVKTAPSQNGPNQNGPKSKQSLVKTAPSQNSFLVISCIEILLHMFILYITCQILNLRIWT